MNNEETYQTANVGPVEQVTPKVVKQAPVVSTQDWVITLLITTIPIVNLVMLLIWAFSKTQVKLTGLKLILSGCSLVLS